MKRAAALLAVAVAVAALAAACGSERPGASPAARRAQPTSTIVPGEEPLETETLGEEEVRTLPQESRRPREDALPPPPETRPCGWARAWDDPTAAHPLLAGVGGVPSPARVGDVAIRVPVREPKPEGPIVVELVVLPDGSVGEAIVQRTTTPPWPEAEDAVLEAVRELRFEPPRFEGTPITVCTTVLIQP